MDKLLKMLHKKLDQNDKKNKNLIALKKEIQNVFEEEHLPYRDHNFYDIYENEVVYRSILNKRAIEKAYFEGYTKMHDYFEMLDFEEKKRLMNYEIHECLKHLSYMKFNEDDIYIAFFDEKMNRIYQDEMVLFSLKQYRRITYDYQDLFDVKYYGGVIYDSPFSSLKLIYKNGEERCFYCVITQRLYFVRGLQFYDFITFACDDENVLKKMADFYYAKDKEAIVSLMVEKMCISDKLANKLRKKW